MNHVFKKVCATFFLVLICVTAHATPAPSVLSITFSILSYAKWTTAVPEICVINNNNMASQFKNYLSSNDEYNYSVKSIDKQKIRSERCEVLIFSTFTPEEEQRVLNSSVEFPALSISSSNTECEIGSAFCLYRKNTGLSFKVNMDSLTQSKVRIDPRVLLLARATE